MLVAATVCALMGAAGFALAAWLARRYGLPFPTGISGIGAGIGVGIVLQMWRKGELKRRASGGSDDRAN
jgi:phosphate/sulfate permease